MPRLTQSCDLQTAVRMSLKGRRSLLLLLSGLSAFAAPATTTMAEPLQQQRSSFAEAHAAHIAEAAQRFGIPTRWIEAVMHVESAGKQRAISSAGAMGLMQIMPKTFAMLRIRHGLGLDPFAPRANILAGTAYLREMYDRYGSVDAMLAAYNAGPGRYDAFQATGRPLATATVTYVATVLSLLGRKSMLLRAQRRASSASDWRETSLFIQAGEEHRVGINARTVNGIFASPTSSGERPWNR